MIICINHASMSNIICVGAGGKKYLCICLNYILLVGQHGVQIYLNKSPATVPGIHPSVIIFLSRILAFNDR